MENKGKMNKKWGKIFYMSNKTKNLLFSNSQTEKSIRLIINLIRNAV